MPGKQKRRTEDQLDSRGWSMGDGLTGMDKEKIELACDRFWSRRGMTLMKLKNRRANENTKKIGES